MNTPWTHGDIMSLHIFILLFVWFIADRCKFYFTDIPRYWYMSCLYTRVWWKNRRKHPTDYAGPR
jgi:hypothetical protein